MCHYQYSNKKSKISPLPKPLSSRTTSIFDIPAALTRSAPVWLDLRVIFRHADTYDDVPYLPSPSPRKTRTSAYQFCSTRTAPYREDAACTHVMSCLYNVTVSYKLCTRRAWFAKSIAIENAACTHVMSCLYNVTVSFPTLHSSCVIRKIHCKSRLFRSGDGLQFTLHIVLVLVPVQCSALCSGGFKRKNLLVRITTQS